MDFCPELLAIDEALRDFQASEGSLSENCDSSRSPPLVELLKSKLSSCGVNLCHLNGMSLRKINFFLELNSDLEIRDLLLDDFDCGYLINHRINGHFLLDIVRGLSLEKYFCESIVFCSPALSCELLDFSITSIQKLGVSDCIETAVALAEAAYLKIKRIETFADKIDRRYVKHIFSKVFTSFEVLVDILKPSQTTTNHSLSHEERATNAQRLLGILKLSSLCFGSCPGTLTVPLEEYQVPLEYDYSKWGVRAGHSQTSAFHNKLLSICVKSVEDISVDLWCEWSELESSIPGKSFQKVVAEEMYACMLILKQADLQSVGSGSVEQLVSMLATMAVKPWDEDDEIGGADFDTILANIPNENKTHEKWLMALLKLDVDIFTKEESLTLMEMSTTMLKFDHVDILFKRIDRILISGAGNERLIKLALKSVEHFSPEEQMQIMISHFEQCGASTVLRSSDFHDDSTQVFNKAVSVTSNGQQEFFAAFIRLCLQSPHETITKLLLEGLTNPNQTATMVEVLKVLQPVCNFVSFHKDEQKGKTSLIFSALTNILQRTVWTEQEQDNFIQLVTLLLTKSVIDDQEFLTSCLLPSLHQVCAAAQWDLLLLFLLTLKTMMKTALHVNSAPIIVILAQIMELSRCNLTTFTQDKVLVCEEATAFIQMILPEFIKRNNNEKNVKWLQDKLSNLSSIDSSYFKKLLPKEKNERAVDDFDSVFYDLIQREELPTDVLELLQECTSKREIILRSIVKIMPMLTVQEWKALCNLKVLVATSDVEGPHIFLFNMLTDALLVLCSIVNKEFGDNLNSLQCVHHCIRNFALVYQDNILPYLPSLSSEEVTAVFRRSIFLLECLPPTIKEACSIFCMTVVMRQLVVAVECCRSDVGSDEDDTSVEEFSSIVALSSVHQVRLALSRKLSEITPKVCGLGQ